MARHFFNARCIIYRKQKKLRFTARVSMFSPAINYLLNNSFVIEYIVATMKNVSNSKR